uniref:ribonuclease H n=1 Tax=Hyaloperonospora arabidopsidis (strain Emoy2) TaxID=559515 RepID=M4BMW9_HYAAE
MTKDGFYAVAIGRCTGVFTTWAKCKMQVEGFAGCRYKKFNTCAEAQAFVDGYNNGSQDVVRAKLKSQLPKRPHDTSVLTDEMNPSPAQKRKHDRKGASSDAIDGSKTCDENSEKNMLKMPAGCPMHLACSDFGSKQADMNALTVQSSSLASMLKGDKQGLSISGSNDAGAAADVKVNQDRKTDTFGTRKETMKQSEDACSFNFKTLRKQPEVLATQYMATVESHENTLGPQNVKSLVAFCDGSALGNGRRKCRAGYACIFPHCEEWNVAKQLVEDRATNNRAEYMAALEAMKRSNTENSSGSRMLYIFSDSMLLIRSMTEWVDTWQKNEWRKSDGKPVQNRDLLEQLVAERRNRCICWTHVKAHTGKKDWASKWNDVADNAARNAAASGARGVKLLVSVCKVECRTFTYLFVCVRLVCL